MDHRPSCDILIVGAGSAGCVLARQLVSQHGFRVTLIEPPSGEGDSVDRHRPANWIRLLGGEEDWNFATESQTLLAGRSLHWPRGRGLGGSSRINAMIWLEPTTTEIEHWVAASGATWRRDEIRESLQRIRDCVRPESPRWISESSQRFLAAAGRIENGLPMVYERVNRNGRRWSPASLLHDLSDDSRLKIIRASVDRILFQGDRAVGVVVDTGSTTEEVHCQRRVILSAGSIATPMILMRSGIGPREELTRHNIDVRIQLPGVGRNLQDHLIMPIVFGLHDCDRFPTRSSTRDIARWQTVGGGPLASNLAECGGFFLQNRVQIHVTPTHYLTHPQHRAAAAMTIGVNVTQPQSRGQLSLKSARSTEPPSIEPMYLTQANDLQLTIQGIRLAREIAGQDTLAKWVTEELLPGAKRCDDESIAKSISRYSQTLYHPVGTCALGTDELSVVDQKLSVRGTENVSIVDASVFPITTTGNPNASVMTIAHHFARYLLS